MLTCNWVAIGNGKLTLWHFPGKRSIPALKNFGVTRIVSLLTEAQGALRVGEPAQALGIAWTWVPVRNGKPPQKETEQRLFAGISEISRALDAGDSVLIHCSAGIHRTGMFAYALLRARGFTRDDALGLIAQMRAETRAGLVEKFLRWGDQAVADGKINLAK